MSASLQSDAPVAIPGVLLGFLERASVAFGCTARADRIPQIHWVSGWKADPDGRSVHCFIPAAFSAGLEEALRENGRFALTMERIGPHETYQFKGLASGLRPSTDAERSATAQCRARFVEAVRALGPRFEHPQLNLPGYILEPAVALRLSVREIFLQTPGPGAGRRMVPPEAAP